MSKQCKNCGTTSKLWLSRCRHLTLCRPCGQSMADKKEKCPDCGTLMNHLIQETTVVAPSWDALQKNYYPARFLHGIHPDFSTGEKWSIDKPTEKDWTLANETGDIKYRGHVVKPRRKSTDKSNYYFFISTKEGEFMAVPAADWLEFERVHQGPQLSLEQAETSMKNRGKAIDKAEKRMRKSTGNSGASHEYSDSDDDDSNGDHGLDYEQDFSDDDVDMGECSHDPPASPLDEEDHGDDN